MEYFNILSKPILSNINIEYKNKNIKEITNTRLHTLYSGNDIIICGKMDDSYNDGDQKQMCLDLTITATTGKEIKKMNDDHEEWITKPIHICKDIKINIFGDNDGDDDGTKNSRNNIERIWAYLKLQQFAEKKLMYNDLIELSEDEKRNDDKLPLSLAMKYKFVTPWTSMIVVKKKEIATAKPIPTQTPQQVQSHSCPPTMDISTQPSTQCMQGLQIKSSLNMNMSGRIYGNMGRPPMMRGLSPKKGKRRKKRKKKKKSNKNDDLRNPNMMGGMAPIGMMGSENEYTPFYIHSSEGMPPPPMGTGQFGGMPPMGMMGGMPPNLMMEENSISIPVPKSDIDSIKPKGFIDDMFADASPRTKELFTFKFEEDDEVYSLDHNKDTKPTKAKSFHYNPLNIDHLNITPEPDLHFQLSAHDFPVSPTSALNTPPPNPMQSRDVGPRKGTLEKVQTMKKPVESTISSRMKKPVESRLRSLRMQLIGVLNDTDDSKKEEIIGVNDFKLIKELGKGAFSETVLVRGNMDNTVYVMKKMNKKPLINREHILVNIRDFMVVYSEWLVKLHYSFQDDTCLYLITEYCVGGNLMGILLRDDILNEEQTRIYMRELADAINAVHELDFIHRNLKPNNVLITEKGHIKLSDLSHFTTENDRIILEFQNKQHLLKDEENDNENTKGDHSTGCSADYIAPEVFSQKGYDKLADYWSMGIIMFECCFGYTPFYAKDPLQTCRKIVHYRKYLKIPNNSTLSGGCVDLLHCLICSYRRRYGFEQIKQHSFFQNKL